MGLVPGKEDGERVLVVVPKGEPLFIANMGVSVYTEDMLNPSFVEDIRAAVPQDVKLFIGDGEFISLEGDFYDFLSDRHKLAEDIVGLKLWACLSRPMTVDHTPYLEMRKYLEENMKQTNRISLIPQTLLYSKEDVLEFFEKTKQTKEGIVIKPNLSYTTQWLKMRRLNTADVVVIAIKKTDEWLKYKVPATFAIGGYDKETGTFKRIGDVSSGLTSEQKEKIGMVIKQTMTGETKDYLYVKPVVVLEIMYHQRMEKGLRFPKIKKVRFDKRPEDCPFF